MRVPHNNGDSIRERLTRVDTCMIGVKRRVYSRPHILGRSRPPISTTSLQTSRRPAHCIQVGAGQKSCVAPTDRAYTSRACANTKYPSNLVGRVAHCKLTSGRRLDSVSRSKIDLLACRRRSSFSQCLEPSRLRRNYMTGRRDKVQGSQRETRAKATSRTCRGTMVAKAPPSQYSW